VDCPKFKGNKKESKAEANLSKVTNTHRSSSQADGSDSARQVSHFQSVLPSLVTHGKVSEFWIQVQHTMHALIGGGFLALRSWRGVRSLWAMITNVAWRV